MKKYQSNVSRSIHEMMEGLYELGAIDAKEMHKYDEAFLVPSAVPNRNATSAGTTDPSRSSIPAVAAPRI